MIARWLLAVVLFATLAAAGSPLDGEAWKSEREHWYRLSLNDQPCGWMRAQRLASADGTLQRSIYESVVRFGRAGQAGEIEVRSQFDETPGGEPRGAEVRQKAGKEPVEQRYHFDPADRTRVTTTSTQDGRTVESAITLPNDAWLTPLAAERFAASRRKSGAPSFALRTIDLSTGLKVIERSAERQREGVFTHDGRELPTTRWQMKDSLMPFATIEEWSVDDVLVRSTTTLAMGRLETTLSDRATALASLRGPPVELMVRTLIKPDRAIAHAGETAQARFRVRAVQGDLPEWPSIGAQRVERRAPNTLEIEVDVAATSPATEAERADERFRIASVSIDSNDEAIQSLARRAVASVKDESERVRAEALRREVHRHIRRKGMSSAFATASETVRSHEGDCTEHAVLLAALLRANGIPARVVTGLVYCSEFAGERDVFGWHMWTQALIDGAWLDLDATLPGSARFHAAHLATGSSAQEHGAMDAEWAALVNLIGNLEIEVLETTPRERANDR